MDSRQASMPPGELLGVLPRDVQTLWPGSIGAQAASRPTWASGAHPGIVLVLTMSKA
ncbi:Glycerol-3-phosphate acyltransferase (fragment) [Mesorhizobium sp. SOD10]